MADWQVDSVADGGITVVEQTAGHRFAFKLVTERDAQTLSAMAPHWAGGVEPAGAHGLSVKAREVAMTEARDQGWIEGNDPDVG